MLLVVLPFWTSFLIRVYAWVNILQHDGLLNKALVALRIVDAPVTWLATDTAVYIGIVYSYFPFMVLPLFAALEKLDNTLLEAAADLGSPPWRTFFQVTVPLSLPGIAAGSLLCFIPIVGEFVIPDLLGSSSTAMIGQTLWMEFFGNRDWPVASALAVVLLCILVPPILIYRQREARRFGGDAMKRFSTINLAALALGLAFLYLPIAILVIYSFNDSRLVTVWGGASLRWYRALFNDSAMLEAASVSLRVAFLSATAATVLGTLAALALTQRFRGKLMFSGMIYAPLVMPEVITGLSLLLLFVALEFQRGFWTIVIAHTTLTLCFVAVVVQSRLDHLRPEPAGSRDGPWLSAAAHVSRDHAAADLAGGRLGLDARLRALARRPGACELRHRAGRHDAAAAHLFGSASWREARDQRGLHHHDRRGGGRADRGVAAHQAFRRQRAARRAGLIRPSPARAAHGRASGSRSPPR